MSSYTHIKVTPCEGKDNVFVINFIGDSILHEPANHEALAEINAFLNSHRNGQRDLMVDLGNFSTMNVAAIGLLINVRDLVPRKGDRLAIVNLQPKMAETFQHCNLDKTFKIFPTVEEASASFAGRVAK